MLFSAIPFLYYFLPAFLLLYYTVPRPWRNAVLLLASLLFYAYGEPVYVFLLIFSSLRDYIIGRIIAKHHGTKKAKAALAFSIVTNLLILGFFKYADFILENINVVTGAGIPLLRIPLPLGISFFTFQTMSYCIDVYRHDIEVEKNPVDFAMYVSMFPQLVAGPIVRFSTVAKDLKNRKFNFEDFGQGAGRFVIGLGKKVLIADALGALSAQMLAPVQGTVLSHWIAILAYTMQVYFDFSGYSDMAIGLGRMIGFHFPENFNYPFISKSVSEFWRRWHISMGVWFRDYIYIPLGGNRVSGAKWVRNIFIVWFCTGLWHGASWNFILWGLYFGVLLACEKLFLGKLVKKLPAVLQHLYTLLIVMVSFVIFFVETGAMDIFRHLGGMVGLLGQPLADTESLYYLRSFAPLMIAAAIGATPIPKMLVEKAKAIKLKNTTIGESISVVLEPAFIACLLLVVTGYLTDATFSPFLYFRF